MITTWIQAWLWFFITATQSLERRQDPLDLCTQTDLALLDACVASAIDQFLTSLDGQPTSSFDYGAVASSINSIANDLTSYGVTVSSLPNPATYTGAASTYSGPFVSDIVSSYSEYTATRSQTDGSVFSFDTTSFQATRSTTETTSLDTSEATSASPTSLVVATTSSQTTDSGSLALKAPIVFTGLLFLMSSIYLTR